VRKALTRGESALVLIVVALTVFSMWTYVAYEELGKDYAALASEHEELSSRYEELNETYYRLLADYLALNESYWDLLRQPGVNITVINDRDYPSIAMELVEAANESIYLIMYILKYDPGDPADPVNELVWALGNACARGVAVNVILEGKSGVVELNQAAFDYLSGAGANVTYDAGGVTTHCKLLVVDERFVLVGSHNWTESAMWYNHEASILIESPAIARLEIEYFNRLWAEATGG